MNFTFRQLQVFQAVVQHLSYTRAAEALYLSQPAVSMQIKQLEENLGVALFEQQGKRIHLTEPGKEFDYYARRITQLVDEVDDVVKDLRGLGHGRLSVSVATTAGSFTTRLLADFAHRYPQVQISLDVTNRETLYRQLENNECDVVIMGRPPATLDLHAEPFMDNPLVMVAPADHPLAGEKAIALARFASEKFVVREAGSGTRRAIEQHFADHEVPFNTVMEMTTNEAIKQAVAAGLGLAIVSRHTLELELRARVLQQLDVAGLPISRQWYMTYMRGKRLSPIAEAFREFVLHNAARFVAP